MNFNDFLNKVNSLEDYRESEKALLSIKNNYPEKAGEVSLDILNLNKGDVYFQSSAFETLYSIDRDEALSYVEKKLAFVEVELLNAMVECVTEDSEEAKNDPRFFEVVKMINEKLSDLDDKELERFSSTINWFKDSFQF